MVHTMETADKLQRHKIGSHYKTSQTTSDSGLSDTIDTYLNSLSGDLNYGENWWKSGQGEYINPISIPGESLNPLLKEAPL